MTALPLCGPQQADDFARRCVASNLGFLEYGVTVAHDLEATPPCFRKNASAIWLLAEFCVHKNSILVFLSSLLGPGRSTGLQPAR